MKSTPDEIFPIVNEQGETVGRATRRECHSGTLLLHPVVHLHVFNAQGELYLQRRADDKDIQPGKWDTSVGGHINCDETPEQALRREAREELGIDDFDAIMLGQYIFKSEIEREYVFSYVTNYCRSITPAPDEISEGRYFTPEEIDALIGSGFFTPNFENEWQHLKPHKP